MDARFAEHTPGASSEMGNLFHDIPEIIEDDEPAPPPPNEAPPAMDDSNTPPPPPSYDEGKGKGKTTGKGKGMGKRFFKGRKGRCEATWARVIAWPGGEGEGGFVGRESAAEAWGDDIDHARSAEHDAIEHARSAEHPPHPPRHPPWMEGVLPHKGKGKTIAKGKGKHMVKGKTKQERRAEGRAFVEGILYRAATRVNRERGAAVDCPTPPHESRGLANPHIAES